MKRRSLFVPMGLALSLFLLGCDLLFGPPPVEQPPGYGVPTPIESPSAVRDAAIAYVNQTDLDAASPRTSNGLKRT